MNQLKKLSIISGVLLGTMFMGCKDQDPVEPKKEDEVEVITDVRLIFTNKTDATDIVTVRAKDSDGEGVEKLAVLDTIRLKGNTSYTLSIEMDNALNPNDVESITDEVKEEDDEHQLFFSFSNNAFSTPTGNGNIDNASDALNYLDKDANNRSLGLSTEWTTNNTTLTQGTFQAKLQHQPDVKTDNSGATDGETDFDITFILEISATSLVADFQKN